MITLILAVLLCLATSTAAVLFVELRRARKDGRSACAMIESARATADQDHLKAFATLNEEFEQMRSRALLAERRLRSEEAPLKGAIRVRSASALRAMNDEENERITREGAERNATTAYRAS